MNRLLNSDFLRIELPETSVDGSTPDVESEPTSSNAHFLTVPCTNHSVTLDDLFS